MTDNLVISGGLPGNGTKPFNSIFRSSPSRAQALHKRHDVHHVARIRNHLHFELVDGMLNQLELIFPAPGIARNT